MIHYDRRVRLLAVCLTFLAGYVDALGFIHLGGYFVSFMSGNTTRMSVGLMRNTADAVIAASLIATFVMGVVLGSLAAHVAGVHHRQAVLALVALLLAVAALLNAFAADGAAVAAMALAMGAENTVFQRNGEVSIGLTYMTGTLVKLGQRITSALLGGDRFAWVPYLLLWLGLSAGAVTGAGVYPYMGLNGLWIAALIAAMLAVLMARFKRDGELHRTA